MTTPWYQRDPEEIDLALANEILSDPQAKSSFPTQFHALVKVVSEKVKEIKEKEVEKNRLAWVQPSYEQTLKLNSWIYGINYIVDFDANRIGKTANAVFNFYLWEIDNDPEWRMFQPHTDHKGRTYRVIPRPQIDAVPQIKKLLQTKGLRGDPKLPLEDPNNQACYEAVTQYLSTYKPRRRKDRIIWVGGPDSDFCSQILMPEFKKWAPKSIIEKYSVYEGLITFTPQPESNPDQVVTLLFKSYDSKDTKWSGAAVAAIILSEGVPKAVYDECKQRFAYPAYASWDYTPYEPRNTAGKSALAFKVFKDPSLLPLTPFIFSGFGIVDAPDYILPDEKRSDLIKNWQNDPQGDARIRGIFYSSSPVVLKNYNPAIHALSGVSFLQLQEAYKNRLLLFRGLDPGWGHVTACAWMALAPDNTRYIYRVYSQAQRSISERCQDIIKLSGNRRLAHPKTKDHFYEEIEEERIIITWIDYHAFKTDEQTKQPFANNYIKQGLIVRPSITYGPKERATMFDDLLLPQAHLPHPQLKKPPGSKLFFLVDEPGVAPALQKMENLFWMTFEKGEKRGLTKDDIQDYNDDEFDACCYVALPVLNYNSFKHHEFHRSTRANTSILTTDCQSFSP